MPKQKLKIKSKRIIMFLFDFLAIPIAWFLSFMFYYDTMLLHMDLVKQIALLLPVILMVQLLSYRYFNVQRGMWRYSSLPDLIKILKSVGLAIALVAVVLFFIHSTYYFPRSILPMYGLIMVALLSSARLSVRLLRQVQSAQPSRQRVLIVGAGYAGEGLARDLLRDTTKKFIPVVFVDDRPDKFRQEIHGVPVFGQCKDIPKCVKQYRIDLIFIAVPSARSQSMRRIVEACNQSNVPFSTLPSLSDLASGRVSVNALREVSLDDLLGRDQVQLNWEKINTEIQNKKIMVTGGGGSIGSELCRQIARLTPKSLTIIESSEFNLYTIEQELIKHYPDLQLNLKLISVVDRCAIEHTVQMVKPDIIFHAAAYKHVPMLEPQIRSAVLNNIIGTRIIAEAAVLHNVKKFILISTDKAVNPTNIMGATKRTAEIFCQNYHGRSNTKFITVRFGNVLGSAGSVIPLFQKQLEEGGPLTVTHPEITRYFMTIPEASQLILQAATMGLGGEIFVLDMGEPIKIAYLAEQMIKLSGKIVGEDVFIEFTGLRPGEKLFEELFHDNETLEPTQHQKILQARHRMVVWEHLLNTLNKIQQACDSHQESHLNQYINSLVPESKLLINDKITSLTVKSHATEILKSP